MRKTILTTMTALSLGVLSAGFVQAGSILCDFTADPSANGFTLTEYATWMATGGNPGGFVQITDAVDAEIGAILLPDFDSGKPVKAFTVSMDVRVGAGTSDYPGEGWSINFVPATAQVVANGADGPGWASDFSPTPVPNLPERGSTEGLGVYALTFDHGGGDILGFNCRYNQVQFAVGGWKLPPTGANDYNGACTDIYSLQTGPATNGVAGLCWANFTMTMHEGGLLDIYWKGSPVITNFPTGWTAQPGRWILAARTSYSGTTGGNEVHEFDNISITTTLADKPLLASFFGWAGGLCYTIQDQPGAVLNTGNIQLTLDGTSVAVTSATKVVTNTPVIYTSVLAAGSHTATITYSSTSGATGSATNTFTVAPYASVPASFAVTGVNTSQRGFKVHPYQTVATQPNSVAWTEVQLAGLYGPNIADLSGADAQGFYANTGVVNYDIDANALNGHFNALNYPDAQPPGIPGTTGSTGNFAEEMLTWLYFPAAGAYMMGVNSDDGFKVSTSGVDVRDPNGLLLGEYDGGRGTSDTMFAFVIPQAGYYPFRLIWENGNGELGAGNAANCEWFMQQASGTLVLINDIATSGAIRAYSAGPLGLPFVEAFSGSFQGFTYLLVGGTTAVAANTVAATLNGGSVNLSISQSGGITTVTYNAPQPLPSPSTNVAVLSFADNGAAPVTQVVTNTFIVTGAIIPTGVALTSGVDTTRPGFLVRPYETAAAQPNRIWWTEMQLAGLEGPNTADLSSANNGWFTNASVINYDVNTSALDGHFNTPDYPDSEFPGLPSGTGADPAPNSSAEILAWVNFPAAGTYTMGVNSDDGFKVTVGRNPRDQFATVLGQYDTGRGAFDSIFQFYVPEAGYYPMRLIWENGTGGCNLEWFSVESDGSMALINDATARSYLRAYCVGPLAARAYVSVLVPAVDEQPVDPTSQIYIQLTDGSTQVDANSIGVSVNGTAVTMTTAKVGGITTAQAPLPFLASGSTNTAMLVYKEVGEPTAITNSWQFILATYTVVPPGLGSPLGSGVASKPGFRYRVAQLPLGYNSTELNPSAEAIEQVLAGLWGPNQGLSSSNIADLSTFTDNGYLDLTGVINMSGANLGAELGYFQTSNGHPDGSAPGVIAYESGALDQFAAEFLTYLEFPKAGIYGMGVSSDDSFRVMPTDKSPQLMGATLYVTAPAAITGVRIPGDPAWGAGGWGGSTPAWPKPAITAKIVLANPNTGCTGTASPAPPANAADLAGNIAMVDRGVCEFGWKALAVQEAGAIAVILVNNRQDFPISMGSGTYGGQVTIPVMMIHQNDGATLKAHLSDPGGLWVTVGWDPELIVGEFDNQGGRATGETAFQFGIMQAGVYPFRLVWNQGGGGYSCEWYSIDASGNRTLINDAVSGALKGYRARVVLTAPSLSVALSGHNVVLTFEGTLQSATNARGTYTDVPGAVSPYSIPATGGPMFFRAYR